jgi:FAD/FMN-containing dehydrogenase
LRDLDGSFDGEIVRPGDPGYDAARVVWNGLVDRHPALIVRPTHVGDVVTALRFAREEDLLIAVRCGGHSIPGFSTCDDGIVIDLSRMRGAQVDPEQRTARVAGGALLAELDEQAQAAGLVCPVGVVSHTGVAGLTLGGGMGRLQRKHGLSIDNLLSVELVTADGLLVRASEEENPELFWGLRGAGANFGIATSFTFRLHPFDGTITHGTVVHPVEHARELAAVYRNMLEAGPDELWMSFGLGTADGRPVATVTVHHCGPGEQAEQDLAELRAFGAPLDDSIARTRYLSVQRLHDEEEAWGHRFYMKSVFLPALPGELVDLAVEQISHVPPGANGGFSTWACGGAMATVPDDATAFTGRDASFWLGAEIEWDDPALDDACRDWCRAAMSGMAPFESTGRYVNDVSEADERLTSIYGDAKAERLVALKREWDPDNVFRLNQNIRP